MDLHVFLIPIPLPPPSPSHPYGSSQCTSPEHLPHASNLGWWSVSPLMVYLFQCYSLRISHPCLLSESKSLFCTSVKKVFLSLLAILWNSAFKWEYLSFCPLPFTSLLFTTICKASSDNHFAFLHFFSMGMVLIPVSCTMSRTSVHLVKAMVFPVVMYGCDSWTVKKAECQKIDAFELWCWRRLLRVPWTARRSNQSIRKSVLNIHWKDWCWS